MQAWGGRRPALGRNLPRLIGGCGPSVRLWHPPATARRLPPPHISRGAEHRQAVITTREVCCQHPCLHECVNYACPWCLLAQTCCSVLRMLGASSKHLRRSGRKQLLQVSKDPGGPMISCRQPHQVVWAMRCASTHRCWGTQRPLRPRHHMVSTLARGCNQPMAGQTAQLA